jgi:hypothetical protein
MADLPELDASARRRVKLAYSVARAYFLGNRAEAKLLMIQASRANAGFLDFDYGGSGFMKEDAVLLYEDGRDVAMLLYFDALVREYFAVSPEVEAFHVLLDPIAEMAFSAFPGNPDYLEVRKEQCKGEALRITIARDRIKSEQNALALKSDESEPPSFTGNIKGTGTNQREAIVSPILRSRGMTKSQWAGVAGVDPSVVYDYMKGISNPRPETRKALAQSIGLPEIDLPE